MLRLLILAVILMPIGLAVYWGTGGFNKPVDSVAANHFETGLDLLNHGDLQEAIREFGEAISIDPELAEAYGKRAVAHAASGNEAAADADFEKAVELGEAPLALTQEMEDFRTRFGGR